MNKKLYVLSTLFCAALLIFASCNDNTETTIDYEWKARNEQLFRDAQNNKTDYPRETHSISQNGSIVWGTTTYFTDLDNASKTTELGVKITSDDYPEFSDIVTCRYKGWYIDADGNEVIFDSTEGDNNAQQGRSVYINESIDGWATVLQSMKQGDEIKICIPYQLGYGATGKYDTSTGIYVIPPYTTLYFYVKLLKIEPNK